MIVFQSNVAGQMQTVMAPYNPQNDVFWRFRYDAVNQRVFFETSPDGVVWNVRLTRNLAGVTVDNLVSELIAGTLDSTINPGLAILDQYKVDPPIGVEFTQPVFSVSEAGGQAVITVRRTDPKGETPVTVNFATSDGTARAGQDYTAVSGTLLFNVGEFNKTFAVPIINDTVFENAESFKVDLSNPVGSVLGQQFSATVTIVDDEADNPINDTNFFVTQQYQDFLGRTPEPAGFSYWTGQISQCGVNSACLNRRRVEVSAAFFQAPEFFDTGGFIYRLYRIALQRNPTFNEFTADRPTGGADLAGRQRLLAENFVTRAEFRSRYDQLNSTAYVNTLIVNAGITLTEEERTLLIISLATQGLTRAQVLLVILDRARQDAAFMQRERNRLFVLMQYLGYLQRDPDAAGFAFWLGVLDREPNRVLGMVCAFVTSAEYQRRFGSSVTRTNAECSDF